MPVTAYVPPHTWDAGDGASRSIAAGTPGPAPASMAARRPPGACGTGCGAPGPIVIVSGGARAEEATVPERRFCRIWSDRRDRVEAAGPPLSFPAPPSAS